MRRLISVFVMIALLIVFSPVCRAAAAKVQDDAELLMDYEKRLLEDRAGELSEEFDVSVVILTVEGLNGEPTWEVCDDHFYSGGYGEDGILLLLSMEFRDWEIATYGSVADKVSDSRCEDMFDAMADDLAQDDYYTGFKVFLDEAEAALSEKAYGENAGLQLGVSVIIGVVVALITILVMCAGMNTARPRQGASDYMVRGSFRITCQRDIFLYSNVTKVRKAQNNSSGGGGGGSRGGSRGKF